MKKYIIYFVLLCLYYCFLKLGFIQEEILRIKYLYSLTFRDTIAFLFYQFSNLVFVYLSIMEFISISKEIVTRIEKKGYFLEIIKRSFLTFIIIFGLNTFMDFLLYDINSLVYCFIDTLFLIGVILLIHMFFLKKDIQIIISSILICFIRSIFLLFLLN